MGGSGGRRWVSGQTPSSKSPAVGVPADVPAFSESATAGKRAAKVARTRARILGAVRQMLLADGADRVNISGLIKVAGVARSTVHYQFHSREGLLEELFRDAIQSANLDWMQPARDMSEPNEAVEAMVLQACRTWAADQMLFRRLMAMAVIDEDARRVARAFEEERQRGIDQLVMRLSLEQQVASPKRARTVLSMVTSFWTFDRLLEETLSKVEAAAILIDIARSVLLPAPWRAAGGVAS
ncbi:MAG: TetR/AcrR family transcriptional regulator [Chloroflexota bacterium]|nr:TetR/AcrR family transcriptional regulator [Chloroflexota bacterium]